MTDRGDELFLHAVNFLVFRYIKTNYKQATYALVIDMFPGYKHASDVSDAGRAQKCL